MAEAPARPYDVLTFDCYGTLIDWESGIAGAFQAAGPARGVPLERAAILDAYLRAERRVEAGPYRRYREVLTESARAAAAALGWPLASGDAAFLADSIGGWPPFPDTNPALERLRAAGYTLGILSNIDDDLLAATRRRFTVDFDFVVTAQQVGSYKPARAHFDAARRLIDPRRWLHVAQSYFHDVVPARALGIPTAWINRHGEAPSDGGRAEREFRTLGELADWLAPGV
ncbi:MAG TPA: HAD-IA family hydrolase [Methylomirabilota bacterium]|jgi:2-haloalkanoic acid dehalogenase type II|nr:HAD-IA family hydrolase [Methylomirabilota bacterium]